MQLGPWTVHPTRQLAVATDGTEVHLTPLEARLLAYLAERPGQRVSDGVLLAEVWKYAPSVRSDAPYFTWRRLVHKLEADPKRPRWIRRVDRGVLLDATPRAGGFVGRARELRALDDAHGASQLVTVCGEAGIGKTRLVTTWLEPSQPFVLLSQADDVLAAFALVAQRLGIALGPEPTDALGRALADAELPLLALDNAEHLAPHLADAIERWLALAPQLRIVVTSRIPLGCEAERVMDLPPMSQAESLQLLVSLAPNVSVADPDAAALVTRVGGVPLAIELCAARLGSLSPSDVLQLLDAAPLDTLAGRGGRHGSVRAAIAWSWRQLTGADQAAAAALAVCRGGFDLDAASALVTTGFAADVLERLVGDRLIRREPRPDGSARFSMSLPVQVFAEASLKTPERDAAWRRHAAHYATQTVVGVQLEEANLVVTSERAAVVGADAARCCAPVASHYAGRGPPERALQLIDRVLPHAGALGPQLRLVRATARAALGHTAALTADARQVYDDVSAPPSIRAKALSLLCHIDAWGSEHERALAEVGTFASGLDAPDDDPQQFTLQGRSVLLVRLGRYEEAREAMLRRLDSCRARGSAEQVRAQLGVIGYVETQIGRWSEAMLHLQEAIDMAPQQVEMDLALQLLRRGTLEWVRGHFDDARGSFDRALAIPPKIGNSALCAPILSRYAEAEAAAGDWNRAESLAHQALELARTCGYPAFHGHALGMVARMAMHHGQLGRARAGLSEAIVLSKSEPALVPHLQAVLAQVLAGLDDPAAIRTWETAEAAARDGQQGVLCELEVRLSGAELCSGRGLTVRAAEQVRRARDVVATLELLPTAMAARRLAALADVLEE